MNNEMIGAVLPKAWKSSEYYSLVCSNQRLFLVKQSDLNSVRSFGNISGLLGLIVLTTELIGAQDKMSQAREALSELSITDIENIARIQYNYSDLIKPVIKQGLGEGKIVFKYPTGGRIFKNTYVEIGFPSSELDGLTIYLRQYGFIEK